MKPNNELQSFEHLSNNTDYFLLKRLIELLKINAENTSYHDFNSSNINPKLSSLLNSIIMPSERTKEIIITFFYSLIIVISIFGNTLVCNVVCRKWHIKTATQVFIANLSISDLLMTILNIPFNLARYFLDNWPFGKVMCFFVPLVQFSSVYISTFTMMCIAFDRFYVITQPFKPRMSSRKALAVTFVIWCVSVIMSLPEASFYTIEKIFTYKTLIRCRINYPKGIYRKYITLVLFLLQYVIPLSIIGAVYGRIVCKIWTRRTLGAVTEEQKMLYSKMKLKTMKIVMVVVIVFAMCWFPLHLYHLLIDFSLAKKSATVFFLCHWFAMSSVCYNPFIYCWLNDNFRSSAKSWILCIYQPMYRIINSKLRMTLFQRRMNDDAPSSAQSSVILCWHARKKRTNLSSTVVSADVMSSQLVKSLSGTKV